ncbi:MAG: hypothetical protein AAB656_04070 [Patescibacteria group bacterium]
MFGEIKAPDALNKFGTVEGGGIGNLLNLILRMMVIGAGIYALFNFVLAGYSFLSAGDDPKKIEAAWAKIWQTALGLTVAAGAFVLAAIFGWLIFGDPNFILNPKIIIK